MFVMNEVWQKRFKAFLVPARVTLGSKEHSALVVVDTVYRPTPASEIDADLRADQSR